jgi:hypothetical protein
VDVTVSGASGWAVRYAHLESVSVITGQTVNPQTQIGTVGASGLGTPPPYHLHYEQRLNGTVQPAVFNGAAITYAYSLPGNPYTSANCGTVGTRLLADVNGDGTADAVVMFRDTGVAMVALANPSLSRFDLQPPWSNEPAMAGADRYFLGDVTGDGRADLVGFWNTGGVSKVMASSGTGFWDRRPCGQPLRASARPGNGSPTSTATAAPTP